jgi:hypothetical protein
MNFTAYVSPDGSWHAGVAWEGPKQVLKPEVVAIGSADTREAITEIAYAQLGRNPNQVVFIAETGERLVLETFSAERHHKDVRAQQGWLELTWVLLFWCVVSLVATALLSMNGLIGLALFLFLALVYVFMRYGTGECMVGSCLGTVIMLGVACATLVLVGKASEATKLPPQPHGPPKASTRADESAAGRARQSQVERPRRPGKDPVD